MPAARLLLGTALLSLVGGCRADPATTGGPHSIYVVEGAVAHPGQHALQPDLTVFEAVMRAKPLEDRCDLSRVRLIRTEPGTSLLITVDVQRQLEEGDSSFNVHVAPGDVILVPARSGD